MLPGNDVIFLSIIARIDDQITYFYICVLHCNSLEGASMNFTKLQSFLEVAIYRCEANIRWDPFQPNIHKRKIGRTEPYDIPK